MVHTQIHPFLPCLCPEALAGSSPSFPWPWASSWVWSMGSTYRKSEDSRREREQSIYSLLNHISYGMCVSSWSQLLPNGSSILPSHWVPIMLWLLGAWDSFLLWLVSKDFTHHSWSILVNMPIFQSCSPFIWITEKQPCLTFLNKQVPPYEPFETPVEPSVSCWDPDQTQPLASFNNSLRKSISLTHSLRT